MRFPISPATPPGRLFVLSATALLLVGCTGDRPGRSGRHDEVAPRVTAPGGVTPIEGPGYHAVPSAPPAPPAVTSAPRPVPLSSAPPPRPATPPPAPAPTVVRSGPPTRTAAPPSIVVPSGPERSSDRGDRSLAPSPIGQLAPEEAPTFPAPPAPPLPPPLPPKAPDTSR